MDLKKSIKTINLDDQWFKEEDNYYYYVFYLY